MRNEGHAHGRPGDIAQALLDFRKMAVTSNRIGLETVRNLTQQVVHLGLASGAADPGGSTGDKMPGIHQTGWPTGE